LNDLSCDDDNYERKRLELNYERLKFLESMEDDLKDSPELVQSLTKFLNKIDKINEYYLKNILWQKTECKIHEQALHIRDLLKQTLEIPEPFLKLRYINDAYYLLIECVEELSEIKCTTTIDEKFVNKFKRKRTMSL
jgi:hypothetical protein